MVLFEVPGWSTPSALVHEETLGKGSSNKRKRPSNDSTQLETATANIEKLLSQFSSPNTDAGPSEERKRKKPKHDDLSKKKKRIAKPAKSAKSSPTNLTNPEQVSTPIAVKKSKKETTPLLNPKTSKEPPSSTHSGSLTALQKNMKQSLDGARFRLINENLYKADSREAHKMLQEDPKVFEEYHVGFRHQVLSWPTNPVDHYIANFSSYSPKTVIADLGCGDAALAKTLVPKGISVISYDLVSDGIYVVEADICDRIPLPGSEVSLAEKSSGEGQIVDVAVCALSLMGTNWVKCLREAWRVLRPSGELHIAEVTSRFTDLEQFVSLIGSLGFRLKSKDTSNTHFVLFEFHKVPRSSLSDKEWRKLLVKGNMLKPCEYKRR